MGLCLLALGWTSTGFAHVSTEQLSVLRSDFLRAEQALRAGKRDSFLGIASGLREYPLYPYLVYDDLRRRLSTASTREVDTFLDLYSNTPLAPRLRRAWLLRLAKAGRWEQFLATFRATRDPALRCLRLRALAASGRASAALDGVQALWLVGRSQPQECDPLFTRWAQEGERTADLVWRRIRLAIASGRPELAAYLARFLNDGDRRLATLWIGVRRDPTLLLDVKQFRGEHPALKEIVLFGLRRLARRAPEKAARAWEIHQSLRPFSPEERDAVHRTIGLAYASQLRPEAIDWLNAIHERSADAQVRGWRMLSAIENNDEAHLRQWLTSGEWVSAAGADRDRWTYWQGHALALVGDQDAARTVWQQLASERSYYGFLAADAVQDRYNLRNEPLEFSEAELHDVERLPGILRSRELRALGRPVAARREWHLATRDMTERMLARAAKLAHDWGWHGNAILTLGRTSYLGDLEVRFPLAYREHVLAQAARRNIDPAWVFAILRQESAFMPDARSPKGALGLMQIMPRTGDQIAKSLNLRPRSHSQLLREETNIRFGSAYLKQLLDELHAHSVLATAAYNAGPHRVRQWLPEGENMPSPLWMETVPFKETRKYLRRVFAYTVIYEQRLGRNPTRLRNRLQPIPARTDDPSARRDSEPVVSRASANGLSAVTLLERAQ
jgi:soluble lytic murein transglycosylase